MRYVLDAASMKNVDSYSINTLGIPSVVLMERAALSVTEAIESKVKGNIHTDIICVCGRGNNGADGLAVARQLYLKGYNVDVYIINSHASTKEFDIQLNIIKNLGIECINSPDFSKYGVIVDALFGNGLSRELAGEARIVVDTINKCSTSVRSQYTQNSDNNGNRLVVAVDIPSGISASTGVVMGSAAVGGMPQAVEAYIEGKNFSEIDMVKRQIISLYEDDFKKIDASGRISALYHSIPAQLAKDSKKYRISTAIGKKSKAKTEELLYELIDSKTILPCYNSTDPRVSLADTKDFDSYKLYLADTGLFVTLMFMDRPVTENDVYAKLLSDKLPANLGFLYENLVAQMIAASGRELFYHTWEKSGSTHYYEVDFLISEGSKVNAFEIKSSGSGKHESIKVFDKKFSKNVHDIYLLSQKDVGKEENLLLKPFYLMPFLIEQESGVACAVHLHPY